MFRGRGVSPGRGLPSRPSAGTGRVGQAGSPRRRCGCGNCAGRGPVGFAGMPGCWLRAWGSGCWSWRPCSGCTKGVETQSGVHGRQLRRSGGNHRFGHRRAVDVCRGGRVLRAVPFRLGGVLLAVVRVRPVAEPPATGVRGGDFQLGLHGPPRDLVGDVLRLVVTLDLCVLNVRRRGRSCLGLAVWRSGSLAGPWLSHLVVDAAIFLVGYDLARDLLV